MITNPSIRPSLARGWTDREAKSRRLCLLPPAFNLSFYPLRIKTTNSQIRGHGLYCQLKRFSITVMAEIITALGVIAASSQLAEQLISTSFAIYGFCLKIHDAPSSIREQLTHLEQLTSIGRLVIQNPGLQTDMMASVLRTCLREAEELRQLLENGIASEGSPAIIRVRKAFVGVVNENKTMGLFQKLERAKVSLGICIQEIDS